MKTVAIIQARMGSSRLPGKVLMDIAGASMLELVVTRSKLAAQLDELVVATTSHKTDTAILDACEKLGVATSCGSEEDVLDRYYQAALEHRADAIVRITSDCPLIDPGVVDYTISSFKSQQPDYASNTLVRTYPQGLDTEIMSMQALTKVWQEAKEPYERTHVTPYIYRHPEDFKLLEVTGENDFSRYRWTVDTQEDLTFVRAVYERLGKNQTVRWQEVVQLLEREPKLISINKNIRQKSLEEG